ncbi:MAG: hypothetical protein QOE70_6659 [Chthoniobacter sp.]|jgi:hypothetical protein|nr:hypothetical protein [Chthoniobacter sp.]
MLSCPSIHVHRSPVPSRSDIVRRPFLRLAAFAFLSMGGATLSKAATAERLPLQPFTARQTPAPTPSPKLKISEQPHLVAIGPMGLSIKPLDGPRVRRPPLLPPPPTVEPGLKSEAAPETAGPREPKEPSAFSPDSPPVLLPKEQAPLVPAPAKKEEPRESVLVPAVRGEPELKDAIIYFETPVGPNGSRISIPAMIPLTSPAPVAQPESRATYRKEKE